MGWIGQLADIAFVAESFNTGRNTSMTHKILFGSALAIAMAFGANAASACSVDAWSVRTNVTAADAGHPTTGFNRYSGG